MAAPVAAKNVQVVATTEITITLDYTPSTTAGATHEAWGVSPGAAPARLPVAGESTGHFVLGPLSDNTHYSLWVRAKNADGQTDSASTSSDTYGPPGSISGVSVEDVTTDSARALWSAAGGTPDPVYACYLDSDEYGHQELGHELVGTTLKLTGLHPGTAYVFGIYAANAVNSSEAVNVPFTTLPDAPEPDPDVVVDLPGLCVNDWTAKVVIVSETRGLYLYFRTRADAEQATKILARQVATVPYFWVNPHRPTCVWSRNVTAITMGRPS